MLPLRTKAEIAAEIATEIRASPVADRDFTGIVLTSPPDRKWGVAVTRSGPALNGPQLRFAEQISDRLMGEHDLAEHTALTWPLPLDLTRAHHPPILRTVADALEFAAGANIDRVPPHPWLLANEALQAAKQAPTEAALHFATQSLQHALEWDKSLART
jgi:hypothetical protein